MDPSRFFRSEVLVEQVAGDIEGRIAAGDWAGGRAFPTEVSLSRLYGVSSNIVTEALQLLRARGRIDVDTGHATLIDQVIHHVHDGRFDRHALDGSRRLFDVIGSAWVVDRCTERDLEALRTAVRAMRAASNHEAYCAAHVEFHESFIRAGHSASWSHLLLPVTRTALQDRRHAEGDRVECDGHVDRHQRILDGIERHDASVTLAAVIDHYTRE